MRLRQKQSEQEALWQKLTLPEEDRDPLVRHNTHRWFRSPNVIDLWRYRDPEEKARIRAVVLRSPIDEHAGL